MPFCHTKCLLYYFTSSFYNISFIRYFIIQFYTLKQYLLHIKIIYYPLPHYHQQQQQQQQPTPQINRHSPQPSTTNISHCYQKKKSQINTTTNINPYTQKKKNTINQNLIPIPNLTPTTRSTYHHQPKSANHQQSKQPTTKKERERDQQEWSGDDNGDDRSGLAHAACAFDDDDDGDDLIKVVMIRVALPMLLAPTTAMTMVMIWSEWPRPWRCGVCHFVLSLLWEKLG